MAFLTLGSIVFQGDQNSVGSGYVYSDLVDWETLSDSKSPVNERNQAAGAFGIGFDYRSSLPISFKGWYRGPDRLTVIRAKRALKALGGAGTPVVMSLTDVDGTYSRVVSIRSIPIDDNKRSLVFSFTVDVIAEDPLLYSAPVISSTGVPVTSGGLIFPLGSGAALIDFGTGGTSGRIAITNLGTARVFPPFQVSGELDGGFVVTDVTSGRFIEFDRQIPLGSTVFVNQRTGRAYIDAPGNDVSGSFSAKNWFSIGSEETHQIQFQPLGAVVGTPTLTIPMSSADF